jgi:hypothetical protein
MHGNRHGPPDRHGLGFGGLGGRRGTPLGSSSTGSLFPGRPARPLEARDPRGTELPSAAGMPRAPLDANHPTSPVAAAMQGVPLAGANVIASAPVHLSSSLLAQAAPASRALPVQLRSALVSSSPGLSRLVPAIHAFFLPLVRTRGCPARGAGHDGSGGDSNSSGTALEFEPRLVAHHTSAAAPWHEAPQPPATRRSANPLILLQTASAAAARAVPARHDADRQHRARSTRAAAACQRRSSAALNAE